LSVENAGCELVGIYWLSLDAIELAIRCAYALSTLEERHDCLAFTRSVQSEPEPEKKWQLVLKPANRNRPRKTCFPNKVTRFRRSDTGKCQESSHNAKRTSYLLPTESASPDYSGPLFD